MNINHELYTHDDDKAALKALQAIPVFSQVMKSFMKIWSEKQFALQNMSSNLKLGENQLSKYCDMLPPICEKLGIAVPELYITRDGNPNAYTSGDSKPFIVMTSGLLETMPEELIPTVLAHECGHIACHHVLYRTMGNMVLNGTLFGLNFFGISELALMPLKLAFFHWMRCSEYSADRAAAICDGSADNIVKMCMIFAGADKNMCDQGNVDIFMDQAKEYKQMVANSKWNKTLEFTISSQSTHPFSAVRAYECSEWTKSQNYANINNLLTGAIAPEDIATMQLPIPDVSKSYVGKNYHAVAAEFTALGFHNIKVSCTSYSDKILKADDVVSVRINGTDNFAKGAWIPADSEIILTYFENTAMPQIADNPPPSIRLLRSAINYLGMNYQEAYNEFANMGFTNIVLEEKNEPKINWLLKPGCILKVLVNNSATFKAGDWMSPDSVIQIVYHS